MKMKYAVKTAGRAPRYLTLSRCLVHKSLLNDNDLHDSYDEAMSEAERAAANQPGVKLVACAFGAR